MNTVRTTSLPISMYEDSSCAFEAGKECKMSSNSNNNIEKERLFAKTLEQVKETAKAQGNFISEDEVKKAFAPLFLSEKQMELVYDYLKSHKIGLDNPINSEDDLTDEDVDCLNVYLEKADDTGQVSEEEKQALTLALMAGEKSEKARLMELYLPDVIDVAKLYAGQGTPLEDLIGEGNLAVAAGIEMLGCLEKAEEARGMFGKMIMDAMEACISQNVESRETGNRIAEHVNRVADMARELSEAMLRKVTAEEVAAENGIPVEEVLEAVRLSGGKIEEIEDMAYGSREQGF